MVRRRSTSPSATDRASALARPLLNDVHAIDHEGMPSLASGPNAPSSSPTPRRRRAAPWLGVAVALSAIGLAPGFACGSGDDGATAGQGGATATGASTGTGSGGAGSGGGGAGGVITTVTSKDGGKDDCPKPCGAAEVCSHGACVPATQCTTDDDCHNDTYCDAAGVCQPWDDRTPPYDPGCVNVLPPGIFSPKVKCEFSVAPPGDPFPGHVDVQSTPMVVNFNNPANAGPPSIIASFTATVIGSYTENLGVIRVLKGSDCSLEANLGGTDLDGDSVPDYTVSSASLAVADLDGDGVAEIVAYGADGSTLAFTKKQGTWGLLWKAPGTGPACGGGCPLGWAGPAIHDLDDDGVPEVLRDGHVISAAGKELSPPPAGYGSYSQGLFSITANLDQDPAIEMTNGQFVWEWKAGAWAIEPYFPGGTPSAPGHVAIADFGAYGQGIPAKNPELAVVRGGYAMVYAIDGTLAMAPIALPGGGGGPPTVGDFDGDGLPELAVASMAAYTVFDIDCGPTPRPGGKCDLGRCDWLAGPCPAGGSIAWSRQSQDISSSITGSSVFDFEADGNAEAVYADECFVRVYSGKTGDVIFSQYRSSCTWYENPIVADVDGNFRADLVTPSNKACSPTGDGIACTMLDANGVDSQFAGVHCEKATDCVSGACDEGLCRCATSAECCAKKDEAACLEEGMKCAPPPDGTKGAGSTCRAAHPHGVSGIRVYSDANDRWVKSRPIWSQHAYSVTHIDDQGTVFKSSQWQPNSSVAGLNNFRQNVPGDKNGKATGDLTAGASTGFTCGGEGATLTAAVCNRGADSIAPGIPVGFYVDGKAVCSATTKSPLAPGACETVACVWGTPPTQQGSAIDVVVRPNDDGKYAECKAGNDEGSVLEVFCKPAG